MSMAGPVVVAVADEMAAKVSERIEDPAQQRAELVRIAKSLQLNPSRIRWNAVLKLSAFALVDEANRQGLTAEEVRAAFA